MNAPAFDAFIAIDWSGASGRYGGIAVAKCRAGRSHPSLVEPPDGRRWTRTSIGEWLCHELDQRRRLLIGLDFAFGFPFEEEAGYFGGRAQQVQNIFDLWELIHDESSVDPDFGCQAFTAHPRFASLFWKSGPRPETWEGRKRRTELACAEATHTRPETVYKMLGSKQVGKASLTGIRVLQHIRCVKRQHVRFWPFEKVQHSAIVEIYPTLFRKSATGSVAKLRSCRELNLALAKFKSDPIPRSGNLSDHETDALISAAGLRSVAKIPATWTHAELTSRRVQREGWIFGVGG